MIRKIKIVESVEKYSRDLDERAMKGLVEGPICEAVMTADTFSKVFSPERIRLLQRIRRNKIKNIYQLAKEMDKPYEVVFRNIKYLEGLGLVKVKTKDNKKVPISCDVSIDMFGEVGV